MHTNFKYGQESYSDYVSRLIGIIAVMDGLLKLTTDEMRVFVKKVEEGSIKSEKTYTSMKNILAIVDKNIEDINNGEVTNGRRT